MTTSSHDWFEQIKDYIHGSIGQNISVLEGTVTSRQANPPSVKVILQPYGVETGWIRVGTPYGGNGFGFLGIPPEEQAVKVIFDMGDRSSAVVVCDVWNEVDLPPTLNDVDDVALFLPSGSKIYWDKNGNCAIDTVGTLSLAGGGAAIAREGDTVAINVPGVGICAGTITSGSSKVQTG